MKRDNEIGKHGDPVQNQFEIQELHEHPCFEGIEWPLNLGLLTLFGQGNVNAQIDHVTCAEQVQPKPGFGQNADEGKVQVSA